MIHFNKETFETALAEGKLMMVDFWAEWCVPCQMLGPVIESLADRYEGRAVIGKINTDEEQELAMGFQITAFPPLSFSRTARRSTAWRALCPPTPSSRCWRKTCKQKIRPIRGGFFAYRRAKPPFPLFLI